MTRKLMNGKLLLAVVCLLLFVAMGLAQLATPLSSQDPVAEPEALIKERMKRAFRVFWEGQDNANLRANYMMYDPDIRDVWGISTEQYRQYQTAINEGVRNCSEYQQLREEVNALRDTDSPVGLSSDAEAQRRMLDIQARMSSIRAQLVADAIDNYLTPDQKRQMKESQLATMLEIPFFAPSAFEALPLTDPQRQQMEKLKQELEPEFERHLENFVERQRILDHKWTAEFERHGGANFDTVENMREKLQERMQATGRKLMDDPEYRRVRDELRSQSQAFSEKFRITMFDVLTDEQWERLQQLIDNPPECAVLNLKKLREQGGESEDSDKPGVWIPGPGAWQPGSSAIPEQYRQERNSRFPRGGN